MAEGYSQMEGIQLGGVYQVSMDLHQISQYASDTRYLRSYRNAGKLRSNSQRKPRNDPTAARRVGVNTNTWSNPDNSVET